MLFFLLAGWLWWLALLDRENLLLLAVLLVFGRNVLEKFLLTGNRLKVGIG